MNRVSSLIGIVLAAIVLTTLASEALAAQPARNARAVESARAVVTRFFEALESGRYRRACAVLGSSLLLETGGVNCPSFFRSGMPDPLVWEVVGTRTSRAGVGVVVELGQNELDHVRMRTWLAIVRPEHGTPKIVQTRLLR